MHLNWNEIRARAAAFAEEWKDASRERSETQGFYTAFFHVFGVKPRNVTRYFEHVVKLPEDRRGFVDLFMPKHLLIEQKSKGRNLARAYEQAGAYFDAIPEVDRPRFIMTSDFQSFDLRDLDKGEVLSFQLADFPRHVDKFGFLIGRQKVSFKDQDPVNIRAAELVGALHDRLEESGFTGHDLERFLVRIVFCLFADDTGVFEPRDIFLDYLEHRTAEDGSDLGGKLVELFQTLNTAEDRRSRNLDEDLAAFPYVNGELFAGATEIPAFNAAMRLALIHASRFDWTPISPAIFGSLFQSVMKPEERRRLGAHYTTEKNILKVIGPLFLDELRSEFERAKGFKREKKKALETLHAKLATLTFFDPACGCGNFLVIAYRELRQLEIDILREKINPDQLELLDPATLSRIDVDQFYGIEIEEFPAEIAKAAMWMMDHIMNNRMNAALQKSPARIPFKASPHITHADALEVDWAELLPPEECCYVFGNPPFGGFVWRDDRRQEQIEALASLGAAGSRLDYVAYWFLKAGDYVSGTKRNVGIAFVATNSITQGEQVPQLWPALFGRYLLEISFAHRTFAWGSDARGRANVHVAILGLVKRGFEPSQKRLFSYPDLNGEPEETQHRALSPYLIDASQLTNRHLVVMRATSPLSCVPEMRKGTELVDGGHYILNDAERDEILSTEPELKDFIRPFVGGYEFINAQSRWVLLANRMPPEKLRASQKARSLVDAVRVYREGGGNLARKLSSDPLAFHVDRIPDKPFLVIPAASSERREYLPIGWLEPPVVPSDQVRIVEGVEKASFAILTSAAHMAWLRHVGGRLKSDYRYSGGMVYNTFPWPDLDDKAKAELTRTGQAILDARAAHPGATLADLYDPDTMPPDLRRAHKENDRTVDRLYRRKPFDSERERVEHLFTLYEKRSAPLAISDRRRRRDPS